MTESTDISNTNLDDRYLGRISALIDGEFDPDSLLATVDFLVRSKEARAFYRESRELNGLLEGTGQRSASPGQRVDTRVWAGIKQQVETDSSKPNAELVDLTAARTARNEEASTSSHHRSSPVWILAAAVFAAVLGLASYELWQDRNPAARDSGMQLASLSEEVEVGGAPESMNDERFFDLATELLEADRKYRREMLALMVAVEDEPMIEKSTEESSDEVTLRGGESNFGEADGEDRGRVEVNFW
jgi:hypothetical protein